MSDTCVLLACQDGTTSLVHLASRGLLATYRENSPSLRGTVTPMLPAVQGLQSGETFISCQQGRSAINMFSWRKDVPVFRCAMAEPIYCVAASPDGGYIIGGSGSGKMYVWDALSGELLRVLQAHYKAVTSLAVSSCSAYVASGGQDALAHVFDLASLVDAAGTSDPAVAPRPVASFSGHSLPVSFVLFSSRQSGRPRLLSASLDHTVRWWDCASGRQVASVTLPSSATCLAMDLDEARLYVGCVDTAVYVLDTGAPAVQAAREGTQLHVSTAVHVSRTVVHTNADLASVGCSAHLQADNSGISLGIFKTLQGHTSSVNAVSVGADNGEILTASDDGTVRVWDPVSGTCLTAIEGTPSRSPVVAMVLLPRRPSAFVTTSSGAVSGHGRSSAISAYRAASLPFLSPLRKHAMPVSTDWRGATSGPTDRDAVLPLLPSFLCSSEDDRDTCASSTQGQWLDPAQGLDKSIQVGIRRLEAACMAFAHAGFPGPIVPVSVEGEAETLRARVASLEDENTRWKNVNNKLAARLQIAGVY